MPTTGRGLGYRVIADQLRDLLSHYRPGQRFLSVADVANTYHCNDHTARAALGVLEREGLLVIYAGQVARVRGDEREKVQVRASRIQISARPATEDEAAAWGITEGSPVLVEIDDQRRELRVWPAALTILDITDQ